MFGTVKEVTKFINDTVKRRTVAKDALGSKGSRVLVTLCDTCFIECNDALLVFHDKYTSTLEALQLTAAQSNERKATDKGNSLVRASAFTVALCCAQKVMALTDLCTVEVVTEGQSRFVASYGICQLCSFYAGTMAKGQRR